MRKNAPAAQAPYLAQGKPRRFILLAANKAEIGQVAAGFKPGRCSSRQAFQCAVR